MTVHRNHPRPPWSPPATTRPITARSSELDDGPDRTTIREQASEIRPSPMQRSDAAAHQTNPKK